MIEVSHPQLTYTLTEWTVKPDADDAFVAEWTQFSEWLLEHRGTESFSLIKDPAHPRRFVSVSAWTGHGSTVPWAAFLERLGRCRALYEQSRSRTHRPEVLLIRVSRERAVDLAA